MKVKACGYPCNLEVAQDEARRELAGALARAPIASRADRASRSARPRLARPLGRQQFGAWFGVELDGHLRRRPQRRGRITHPGYEHLAAARRSSASSPNSSSLPLAPVRDRLEGDYSGEPTTLVEFQLEATPGGTHLRVVESGFDASPPRAGREAFRMNSQGWAAQMKNIERHVGARARGRRGEPSSHRRGSHSTAIRVRGPRRQDPPPPRRQARRGGRDVDSELGVGTEITRQAITKHLYALADAGLVRGRMGGREGVEVRAGPARRGAPLARCHLRAVGRRPRPPQDLARALRP